MYNKLIIYKRRTVSEIFKYKLKSWILKSLKVFGIKTFIT